jgi:DNA repair protein RecO (recombination protein O)
MADDYSEEKNILDLQEGNFVKQYPAHSYFLDGQLSYITSQLLKVRQPEELEQLHLNSEIRRNLLQAYQHFYSLHIQDFGTLRSLPVLQEILS